MDEQQKRLFIALVLCAGVAMLWQTYILPPPVQPTTSLDELEESGEVQGEVQELLEEDRPALEQGEVIPVEDTGLAEEAPDVEILPDRAIQGLLYSAEFSQLGGALQTVNIEGPEQYIPRQDELSVFPQAGDPYRSFIVQMDSLPELNSTTPFHVLPPSPEGEEGSGVTYQWSNGELEIEKVFTPDLERSYVTDMTLTMTNRGSAPRTYTGMQVYVSTTAEGSESMSLLNPIANIREVICYVGEDVLLEPGDGIEEVSNVGEARWVGVQDRYFLTALIASEEQLASGCSFIQGSENTFAAALDFEPFTLNPEEQRTWSFSAFTGPKDTGELEAVDLTLSRTVDYGWFSFLAYPMKWILKFFFNLTGNWGVAIILLTIVVRTMMFPWTHRAFKSMEKMKEIQPKLTALKEKYENDKTRMTEETMKLYKEHNVNPFGCLPMLLQMPIFIALYRCIYGSVELYKAEFAFWIHDLSQSDPYYILPVLMASTMLGQQMLMPAATDNPQMKMVMRIMPVMFGGMMLFLPSGLVLYIFISSLLGILQQWTIRRKNASNKPSEPSDPGTSPDGRKLTRQQRRQLDRHRTSS